MTVNLPVVWRSRAEELEPFAPAAATAFRQAAEELQEALRAAEDEQLTLTEAARESGYATRTLREKIAKGEIANRGAKHRPRVRRGDLPRRARSRSGSGWDPAAHVERITRGAS